VVTASGLPACLRKPTAIEQLIHWLNLKAKSTDDLAKSVQVVIGQRAASFNTNVIVRLKAK